MTSTSHWHRSLHERLATLAVAALCGCQAIDSPGGDERAVGGSGVQAACLVTRGSYELDLAPADGACEAPDIDSVVVAGNTTIEQLESTNVETETVIKGCSVFLSWTERDKASGLVRSTAAGTLTAQREGQLGGKLSITLFNAGGAMSCAGEFDADLSADVRFTAIGK